MKSKVEKKNCAPRADDSFHELFRAAFVVLHCWRLSVGPLLTNTYYQVLPSGILAASSSRLSWRGGGAVGGRRQRIDRSCFGVFAYYSGDLEKGGFSPRGMWGGKGEVGRTRGGSWTWGTSCEEGRGICVS